MHKEYTAQEKAAIVTELIILGQRLTTKDIMGITGLTRSGVYYMMIRLSRVLSIYCNSRGEWCRVEEEFVWKTIGPCWSDGCNCNEYDGRIFTASELPKMHDGCTCIVSRLEWHRMEMEVS